MGPIEYTPDRARWPRWIMAALATVLMLADAALLALALPLI